MARKRYTAERLGVFAKRAQIAAMLRTGVPYSQIVESTGVSKSTISAVAKALAKNEPVAPPAIMDAMRGVEPMRLVILKRLSLEALERKLADPEQAARVSAGDLARIFTMLDGQDRLSQGQPTSIVEHLRGMSDDDLEREKRRLLERLDTIRRDELQASATDAEFTEASDGTEPPELADPAPLALTEG